MHPTKPFAASKIALLAKTNETVAVENRIEMLKSHYGEMGLKQLEEEFGILRRVP